MDDKLAAIVDDIRRSIDETREIVESILDTIGRRSVQAAREARMERILGLALDRDEVAPADAITPETIVVTRETNRRTGETLRGQFVTRALPKGTHGLFLGRVVGDREQIGDIDIEIKEIYAQKKAAS